jgi:putative tricarboxylic transport membrane protein
MTTAATAKTALVFSLLLSAASSAAAQPAGQPLRLIAPAAPGGGWDQTARVMQQVLLRANLVVSASVENIPGAAGTIGLTRFGTAERGNGDVLMLSGLVMVGAVVAHHSDVTLAHVTPVARLLGEWEVLVVPAASPFKSLPELISAFKNRPEAISWGGGSAAGTDQILAGLIADAVGVAPKKVNYIAYSGGGESLAAVLGGQVTLGINGLAEFAPQIEAGTVRALAISSPTRLQGVDVPTLREQGVDVSLENWRSVVAPPGISAADLARLEKMVGAMVQSAPWREALERYRWNDSYLPREAFAAFVTEEQARVAAILAKLGTGDPASSTLGLYPILVFAGLGSTGLLFGIGAWRSKRASISNPNRGRWQATAIIVAAIMADLLLMERAGFVFASAALFWLTSMAFDRRHPLRDAIFAVAFSIGAYVLFARLLQLPLPAGVLAGVI